MVRTVKAKTTRSLNKGERAVLLPGSTGAAPWEVWVFGIQGTWNAQTCATPLDNRLRKNTTLALPVSQVFSVPLWLNETDEKQFVGMITLQLELRGLQPRGNGAAVFDWTMVTREGARTLVVVGVLPASLAPEIQAEAYETFDLSARYLSFPENSLILWLEQDHLVAAFTRGPNLVYCQALTEGRITPRVVQDLNCMKATLAMQDILLTLQQAVLWVEATSTEISILQAAFPLPVKQAERPPPKIPSRAWKLIPSTVGVAKRTREIRRWQGRGLLIAIVVYLLVVIGLASRFLLTSLKVDELRKWQSSHSQTLALVRETRTAWKELGPVVDENHYPLELLLHASEAIPSDQLHLTLFEASDGHLLIKGEAKNAAAAFDFLDKLKSDPHFAGYTWDMGQPHLLPNDLAQLQIEGTLATAN